MLEGKWKLVGTAQRNFLDELVQKGLTIGVVELSGSQYSYDIDAMTQTNLRTKRKRRLRRCFRPTEARLADTFDDFSNTRPESVVMLHVYDVGTDSRIQTLNGILSIIGTGAYHAAVEIFGSEWSFGGCDYGTGVFQCPPKQCTMHNYSHSLKLGSVHLTARDVEELLNTMSGEWMGPDYDLLRRNCCHFASEFAQRLGVGPIPSKYTSLAQVGAKVQDAGLKFEEVKEAGKEARGAPMQTYRFGDVCRGVVVLGRTTEESSDSCWGVAFLKGIGRVVCR